MNEAQGIHCLLLSLVRLVLLACISHKKLKGISPALINLFGSVYGVSPALTPSECINLSESMYWFLGFPVLHNACIITGN